MRHERMDVFGVQFHPEVYHTQKGVDVFKNFLKIVREK
jgi:GMP synthase (glutamine-hydrolysing)